ncbi:MAG: hypothetical protein ABI266_03760 [Ginsengibacter sp.]
MKKILSQKPGIIIKHLLFLILFVVLFFRSPVFAQENNYTKYLQQNQSTISIDSDNNLSIFDDAFYKNQVFLVSESHGYYKPQEVDFALFKQINKKTGVRYYLAEIDFSQAYYLNQYLNTGDESLLKRIYQYWYKIEAQWGCKAGFAKWQKMYSYNKTLPAGKKIIVLGLDETQDVNMNVKLLNELIKKTGYKKSTNRQLDSMAFFAATNFVNDSASLPFIQYAGRLDSIIHKNPGEYEKLLKSAFFSVNYIIHNIASKKGRESKLFENFTTFYNQYNLADEKIYGFMGRFHAMQDSINKVMPFAGMLKNSKFPLKDKIISIPIFCIQSSAMIPTNYLPAIAQQAGTVFSKVNMVNDDSYVYQVNGIKLFESFVPENAITIFKLNGESSPFNEGLNLVESTSTMDKSFEWFGNKNAATTSYFQYAVIARNSDWAVPYGDNLSIKNNK